DGSEGRITIQKVDDRSFTFHFPRPEADPLLATNMSFGPAFLYKAAKDRGGAKAVKDLFTVASDPKELPSMGPYFISEYTPGQRIIYERNDDYWEKDKNGQSIFYPQKKVMSIVSDVNTKLLLFKQGKLEDYGP
ncbi:MAG TPA: ABC transporter substrate-binding protein, partial [Treponema sp.]|nr:ABC transporter substrate-binding protein [Treponema sp.]